MSIALRVGLVAATLSACVSGTPYQRAQSLLAAKVSKEEVLAGLDDSNSKLVCLALKAAGRVQDQQVEAALRRAMKGPELLARCALEGAVENCKRGGRVLPEVLRSAGAVPPEDRLDAIRLCPSADAAWALMSDNDSSWTRRVLGVLREVDAELDPDGLGSALLSSTTFSAVPRAQRNRWLVGVTALVRLKEPRDEVQSALKRAQVALEDERIQAARARDTAKAEKVAALKAELDGGKSARALVLAAEEEELGVDVSEFRPLASALQRKEELAEEARLKEEEARKAAYQRKWGPFASWRQRPANAGIVGLMVGVGRSFKRCANMAQLYEKTKKENDESVRDEDVSVSPIFPSTTGSFTYVKALSQYDGEALFMASDGAFVLRLSPGDSFNAYPGQIVELSMHSRGERMNMTNGTRLPVFLSGTGPVRTRRIPAFIPNRTRENALKKRIEAERSSMLALLRREVVGAEKDASEGVSKRLSTGTLAWAEDASARLIVRDDEGTVVYCLDGGLDCGSSGGEVVDLETLVGGP